MYLIDTQIDMSEVFGIRLEDTFDKLTSRNNDLVCLSRTGNVQFNDRILRSNRILFSNIILNSWLSQHYPASSSRW